MGQTKATFVGSDFPPSCSQEPDVFIWDHFSLLPLLTELGGGHPILRQKASENTLRKKYLTLTLGDNPPSRASSLVTSNST